MAKNNETTTKFKVDISELKAGMQEASRQIRLANAEFKAVSSGMDDWSKSTDGLNAKIKQLETVLESENKKLSNLKQQLKLVEKEQGANSAGADELRIKIANQQATVNKTQKSLEGYRTKLDDLEKELDNVADASDEAADATKDFGDEAEKTSDGFTVLKGAMASLIADGVKNLLSSIVNLSEETREFRNEMAKLETAFANHGAGVDGAKKTYEEFYGILGDEGQATEAVAFLAKLTDNEKDLATWTDIATGVYAEFGASLPIEGLTEAANETAKVGAVTGPLADALNWAGESEDKFNEKLAACSSEQERQKLIMDTLNGIYSDSATTFRETNAEVINANKAQNDLNQSTASLGEVVEPLTTKFKELKAKGIQWLVDTGVPMLQNGFNWLKDNLPTVAALMGTLTAAWLTFGGAQKLIDKWNKIVAASQKALNIVMNANPIGLIVIAIGLLVTAFITLWNNCEGFRKFWIGLWDGIKKAAKAVADWFSKAWSAVIDWFKMIWQAYLNFYKGIWDGIKNAIKVVVDWFKNTWQAISDWFKNLWEGIKDAAKNAWEGIKNIWNKVSSWYNDKVVEPIKKFFTGLWDGLKNGAKNTWEGIKNVFAKVGNFFGNIWNTIKEKFTSIGTKIGDAIGGAFKKAINAVLATVENSINWVPKAINAAIGLINKLPGVEIGKMPLVELPRLYKGGVLKKGQVGLLEGSGAEAVVPLENNARWIRKTAADLKAQLRNEGLLGGGKGSVTNNYNFTQNNTSPKALSRLEIYRQTKNQLAFAKGV